MLLCAPVSPVCSSQIILTAAASAACLAPGCRKTKDVQLKLKRIAYRAPCVEPYSHARFEGGSDLPLEQLPSATQLLILIRILTSLTRKERALAQSARCGYLERCGFSDWHCAAFRVRVALRSAELSCLLSLTSASLAGTLASDLLTLVQAFTNFGQLQSSGRLTGWNTSSTTPCTWTGVTCSSTGQLVALDISNYALEGSLASSWPSLASLASLQYFFLNNNST